MARKKSNFKNPISSKFPDNVERKIVKLVIKQQI